MNQCRKYIKYHTFSTDKTIEVLVNGIFILPCRYRALYNYKPQNDDEVELSEGDIVFVMEKCDDGWFVGTSQRTGIFGTFPGNYVAKA